MAGDVKIRVASTRVGGTAGGGSLVGATMRGSIDRGIRKLREPLQETMLAVFNDLKIRHGQQWTPSGLFGTRAVTRLRMRSGRGLMSIRESIVVKQDMAGGMIASISAGDMGIHATGGTVHPKSSQYLAIPTVYALTAQGVARKSTPWAYDRTFARRTARGNLFIFQKKGKGERPVPLYLLKRSVRIPKRLDLKKALEDRATYFERKAYAALVKAL